MSGSLRIPATAFLAVLGLGSGVSHAQALKYNEPSVSPKQIDSRTRVSASQSIVEARLASDEIEEGKINDVYQEVVKTHLQGDYRGAADKYRSLVIPMAEIGHPYAMAQEHFTLFWVQKPRGFTLQSAWPMLKKFE